MSYRVCAEAQAVGPHGQVESRRHLKPRDERPRVVEDGHLGQAVHGEAEAQQQAASTWMGRVVGFYLHYWLHVCVRVQGWDGEGGAFRRHLKAKAPQVVCMQSPFLAPHPLSQPDGGRPTSPWSDKIRNK